MTIIVQNADFEDSSSQIVYGFDEGLIFIGRNSATVKHNYASDIDSLSVVGSPTFDKGAVFKNGSAYINTGIQDSKSFTMISIVKNIADAASHIMSNYNNSPTDVSGLMFRGNGVVWLCGSDGLTSQATSLTGFDVGEWQFIAGTVDDVNRKSTLFNLKTKNSATKDLNNRVQGTKNYRIGSSYSGDGSNQVEIFMAFFSTKVLTKTEIDIVAEKMRLYANKYGITV